MWTNKELFLISLATGLVFCFATIYTQKKFHQYVDNKVTEKSANPLASLLPNEIRDTRNNRDLGQMRLPEVPSIHAPTHQPVLNEPQQNMTPQEPQKRFHDSPPGSGERWTPLEIK